MAIHGIHGIRSSAQQTLRWLLRKPARLWGGGALLLLTMLVLVRLALAATFTVNHNGDAPDNNAGDGVCATSTGVCTLRAAIQEANATSGPHTINFNLPGCGTSASTGAGTLGTGLAATYFNTIDLSGSVVLSRNEAVNFDFGNGSPGSGVNSDSFSARWTGTVTIPTTGNYRFQTNSDDGVRLWVNGTQVINNWTVHAPTNDTSGTLSFTAGQVVSLRLEWFEQFIGAVIRLRWQTPSTPGSFAPIPIAQLTPVPFSVSSGCSINVTGSALPAVTRSVFINGQSQPGWTSNPIIELVGTSAGGGANGLTLQAGNSTVRGLVINRFSRAGLELANAGGNTVQGNWIGLNSAGTSASANATEGINVFNSPNNTIGGTTAATRNVVSGNGNNGIVLAGTSTGNLIQGNFIGSNAAGTGRVGNNSIGIYVGTGGNTIGEDDPGQGNVVVANGNQGIFIENGSDNEVLGNTIGTNAAGASGLGNNGTGLWLQNAPNTTVGGTIAGAGNVISGNGWTGIWVGGSTNLLIQGNTVGLAPDRTTSLVNASGRALWITSNNGVNSSGTVGGTATAARNWFVAPSGSGSTVAISGNGTGPLLFQGNFVGLRADGGAAATRSDRGVMVGGAGDNTSNVTIGGTAAGAGNVIANTEENPVRISGTGTGNAVLGNLMYGSSFAKAGLDVTVEQWNDSTYVNDGAKTAGQANLAMDTPIFTSVTRTGNNLRVRGYVGSASGQAVFANSRVEVFRSDQTPNPTAREFLGAFTTGSSGSFDVTFALPGSVTLNSGDRVTATATDSGNNTSKLAPNATVSVATPSSISGTVFEDINYGGGAGRSRAAAAGAGVAGATVELLGSDGALIASTTTALDGSYSFNSVPQDHYMVRVVQSSVRSTRAGSVAGLLGVQTWRYEASWTRPGAVTNEVGGLAPAAADGPAGTGSYGWTACSQEYQSCAFSGTRVVRYGIGSSWTTRVLSSGTDCSNDVFGDTAFGIVKRCELLDASLHSVSSASTVNGNVTGLDFGFNFSTIVNTNDGGQGSLRQFITNANAFTDQSSLAQAGQRRSAGTSQALPTGLETSIFMIPRGVDVPGIRAAAPNQLTAGVAIITTGTALPAVVRANVALDGSTQTANVGNSNAAVLGTGGTVGVDALALPQVQGPEVQIVGATGISEGIRWDAANGRLRGLAVVGYTRAVSLMAGASSMVLEQNVLGTTATSFTNPGALRTGGNLLLLSGAAANVTIRENLLGWSGRSALAGAGNNATISGNEFRSNGSQSSDDALNDLSGTGLTIRANLITATVGLALDSGLGTGSVMTNNTLSNNGQGNSEIVGAIIDNGQAVFSRNIVTGHPGSGLSIGASTRVQVTQNAFFGNNTSGLAGRAAGISLNNSRAGSAVTANDGAKTVGAPNQLMDHPTFTGASLSGNTLTVAGHVGTAAGQSVFGGATVEVFVSSNNSSGFGEGQTYLGTLTADASGNFSGTIDVTGRGLDLEGVRITGTAADASGNTSEFGANVVVLNRTLSGRVFEDVNYGGGRGRSRTVSGGIGRSGATVEIYTSTGAFLSSTTTDANGDYTFPVTASSTYLLRVVNSTVSSSRTGWVNTLLPVQTFRTQAVAGVLSDVTDFVGGENPALTDAAANTTQAALSTLTTSTTTAQSLASIAVTSTGISGIDFGFNFNTVVNTADTGQGSLRQAITNANALTGEASLAQQSRTTGREHIVFMMPNGTTGAGGSLGLAAGGLRSSLNYFITTAGAYNVATITLASASPLPPITTSMVIDAQTQPGWLVTNGPLLELSGASIGVDRWGFQLSGGTSTVRGFVINRFGGGAAGAILVSSGNGHVIAGNWLGLTAAGTAASANGLGLRVDGGTNVRIGGTTPADRNVISGNTHDAITLPGTSDSLLIHGNYVGLNAAGTGRIANTRNGIWVRNATNTQIGGAGTGEGNVIAGSAGHNVEVAASSSGTTIRGNLIGLDATGAVVVNGASGIHLQASGTVIGGTSPGARNVIGGSTGSNAGIVIQSANNVVQGNYIGVDPSGTAARGNGYGLFVTGTGNQIGGNVSGAGNLISGNTLIGVQVEAAGNTLQGNVIGLNAGGTAAVRNVLDGVWVQGNAANTTVGGSAAGAGNVISGNGRHGVVLIGSGVTGAVVQGNRVGVNATATAALGNGAAGVVLADGANGNTVGGTAPGAGNTLGGSGENGVRFDSGATGNTVQGNFIGTDSTGTRNLGNALGGVRFSPDTSNNTLGGTVAGAGNVVANNLFYGASVGNRSAGNRVLGNRFYGNAGLGIELEPGGVAANDGELTPGSANVLMDHPVLTSARARGNRLTVAGYVGSAPGQAAFANARVEIFESDNDASGFGEGRTYLGFLTTDANGAFSGTVTMPVAPLRIGTRLTGTATDAAGNTSEFGANFTGLLVDFVVNTNDDLVDASVGDGDCLNASGLCSLRAAIAELNAWSTLVDTPTITFAIPGCSNGAQPACRIAVGSALPTVSRAMTIDAQTQPGWSLSPIVGVDGTSAARVASGLTVQASGSTVRGLSIGGFGVSGIVVSASNTAIEGNHVGLALDGTTALPNGSLGAANGGVWVTAGSNVRIGGTTPAQRNVLSGNGGAGLWVDGGVVAVTGNYVGTNAAGTAAVGNGRWGVVLQAGNGHRVGGSAGGEGNVISGNAAGSGGVFISGTGQTIQGNTIGLRADGTAALPNGDNLSGFSSGIDVRTGTGHLIGGTGTGEGNTIAGNLGSGVRVSATQVRILGNAIRDNVRLGIDLGADGVTANDGVALGAINSGMDHPVLNAAGLAANGLSMQVSGVVGTGTGQAAFAGARIEIFRAAPEVIGFGEGAVFLGALTADANGRFSGTVALTAGALSIGDPITATATDAAGHTSEFGPNWVTTTAAALAPSRFNAFETSTLLGALTGSIKTMTAGLPTPLSFIAIDTSGTGLATAFGGSVTVEWMDARAGGTPDASGCSAAWAVAGTAATLSFTAGLPRLNASITPPDAGRDWRLRFTHTTAGGQVVRSCSTDNFAVKPSALTVTTLGSADSSSAGVGGAARSLANGSATGGVVHRAGRPFALRAAALASGGAATPGYDGTAQISIASCALPATGCVTGTLQHNGGAPALTAAAGQFASDAITYSEVGAIRIRLTDTGFADVDAADSTLAERTIASGDILVGRFVPDRFDVAVSQPGVLGTANAACTAAGAGYTFFGQAFGWNAAPQATVTARNAQGTTTVNWTGALQKLDPVAHATQTLSVSAPAGTALAQSHAAMTRTDLGAGIARLSAQSPGVFSLARGATPVASTSPTLAWALAVADASEAAVAGNGTVTGSAAQAGLGFDQGSVFHHGRLALAPGHGDARRGVRLMLELQRFNGNGWVTLTEDRGCVTVTPQQIAVSNGQGVFTTAGLCAAPPLAGATTRGGRAWLPLPGTPGQAPGRLRLGLQLGSIATGQACSAVGVATAVAPLGLPHLGTDPSAVLSWGRPNRDIVLTRERF
jgi:CSLREA domain-containing protein